MRQGKTISELSKSLLDIKQNAIDYSVPASRLQDMIAEMVSASSAQASAYSLDDIAAHTQAAIETGAARVNSGALNISIKNGVKHSFAPSSWAHHQIAEYADIPKKYYDRIGAENKPLLVDSVNHGFRMQAARADKNSRLSGRMLRTHRGNLRAFLSTRYRRIDNFDLLDAVMPSLMSLDFEPISMELTDQRLYFKVVSPKVTGEIKPGDVVQYGLVISNSDVGAGSAKVELLIYRLACSNGMIMSSSFKQTHIGKNQSSDDIGELLTDETKRKVDDAFFSSLRDVVASYAKPEVFERALNTIRAAEQVPITNFELPILIENAAKAVGLSLSSDASESILGNIASGAHGAGMNKWGLANAFTFAAGNVASIGYDDATDLERSGSKILALNKAEWEAVNRRVK